MLTLERAKELFATTTTEEHLILHAANVSAAMSGMAKHFGADSAHWAAVGYIYDYDYQQHPDDHHDHRADPADERREQTCQPAGQHAPGRAADAA